MTHERLESKRDTSTKTKRSMKTKELKISQVKINGENPRSITTDKFNKLVNSILCFPEMLDLRPIVVDKTNVALGGNMRAQALKKIADMNEELLTITLNQNISFKEKTGAEQKKLIQYWLDWISDPVVITADASSLTEAQRKEFIVKDNVQYGAWDYDALANKFDGMKLRDWGMDIWDTSSFITENPVQTTHEPTDEVNNDFDDVLPSELQGLDITPNDLPKIQGSDEVLMERIIIVYPKDQTQKLCELLGLTSINKVVYNVDEIFGME